MKKLLAILFVLFFTSAAMAQSAAQIDNLGNDLSYKTISTSLTKIEKLVRAESPDIEALVGETSYLNETSVKLDSAKQGISDRIKLVEKRIEALGEVDEKLPEAKVIAQKRQEFNKELSDEKTRLSEIEILMTKIEELNVRIFEIRNQMIWGNMLNSEWVLLNPATFLKSNNELVIFCLDIAKSPFDWYANLTQEQIDTLKSNVVAILAFIVLIGILGYILRRVVIKRWGYRSDSEMPRLGRKIFAAFVVWCAYGIIPAAVIGFCLYWLISEGVVSGSFFGVVLPCGLYYLLYIIMGRASFRVVFTPYNEKWRIISMSTEKAKRITRAIYFSIYVIGVLAFLQEVASHESYSLGLISYLMAMSAAVKACSVMWITHIYVASEPSDEPEDETDDETEESEGTTFKIGVFTSLFALAIMGLAVCGYARLAAYVVNRSMFSAIIVMAFGILRRLIYDVIQHVLLMGLWVKTFKMRRMFLRKIDFWFGVLADPLLFLLLIAVLLLLWGVPFDVMQTTVYKAISGFMIGGVKISLISIFWGIMAFIVCLWIIKFIRYRIEFRLLEKTSIDAGTKHSLASGFAYIGYVLAGLLAIAIMGGDLTNIALIAGALSVGIGLGLQDVVNNFVSGIIMLFERPIKVGDWVIINGEEGQIKQINIRSTEVETFNRSSVIIPNSKVLSNSVTNLTHQNNWVRYGVKVGVAYGSDVDLVKKVLLECATSHPKVTKKPAPYVLFQNFGDSSLDFELRFYVSDIWSGWTAPSDIRYQINKRFNEE
jgi:small-conductance mechanosensitive channel